MRVDTCEASAGAAGFEEIGVLEACVNREVTHLSGALEKPGSPRIYRDSRQSHAYEKPHYVIINNPIKKAGLRALKNRRHSSESVPSALFFVRIP